jgi:DNA-binding transcriptional MerR regulator
MGGTMRIGELSRRTGVDQRLLRYYEQQDLLHPARQANGYRVYQESDVTLVLWIRRLLAAGLSTATIADFQSCVRPDNGSHAADDCRHLADRLRAERARIDAAIADLAASRATLDELITADRLI